MLEVESGTADFLATLYSIALCSLLQPNHPSSRFQCLNEGLTYGIKLVLMDGIKVSRGTNNSTLHLKYNT